MKAEELRAIQAPLKKQYQDEPDSARLTLRSEGTLDGAGITCRVTTFTGPVEAGLHPATGGDGSAACSGDMLLEALVGCAGVTLRAVATAMGIEIQSGMITAEGDLDFRGTLGVQREVPVGLQSVRLHFDLCTKADEKQLATLLKLTERYCVVLQTLNAPPRIRVEQTVTAPEPGS